LYLYNRLHSHSCIQRSKECCIVCIQYIFLRTGSAGIRSNPKGEQRQRYWSTVPHRTKASCKVKQQNSHQGCQGTQQFSTPRTGYPGRPIRSGRPVYTAHYWTVFPDSTIHLRLCIDERCSPEPHNWGRQNVLRRASLRGATAPGVTIGFEPRGGLEGHGFLRTSSWPNGWPSVS